MARLKLRPEVRRFAEMMERRLRTKDPLIRRGEWVDWREAVCDLRYLLNKAHIKLAMLRQELLPGPGLSTPAAEPDLPFCQKQAADVANFLMMVEDKLRQEAPDA